MKRNLTNSILIVALLIGMCLLLYPTVSDYINSFTQSRVIKSYEEATKNMTEDQFAKYFEEAHSFNELIANTPDVFYKPNLVPGYDNVLDTTGTGIMGYISIEKIKVELPIYHGVEEGVLQIAVGHLPGTSLPVGGEGTHAVLSGHRGLPSSKLFSDLDKMEIGDVFYITVLNQIFAYQVDQIRIVLPIEVDDLQLVPGKDYCSLVTCTPYGVNSHRLLVRGVRVDYEEDKASVYVSNEAYVIDPVIVMPIVAAPLLVLFVLWTGIMGRRRRLAKKIYQKGMQRDDAE